MTSNNNDFWTSYRKFQSDIKSLRSEGNRLSDCFKCFLKEYLQNQITGVSLGVEIVGDPLRKNYSTLCQVNYLVKFPPEMFPPEMFPQGNNGDSISVLGLSIGIELLCKKNKNDWTLTLSDFPDEKFCPVAITFNENHYPTFSKTEFEELNQFIYEKIEEALQTQSVLSCFENHLKDYLQNQIKEISLDVEKVCDPLRRNHTTLWQVSYIYSCKFPPGTFSQGNNGDSISVLGLDIRIELLCKKNKDNWTLTLSDFPDEKFCLVAITVNENHYPTFSKTEFEELNQFIYNKMQEKLQTQLQTEIDFFNSCLESPAMFCDDSINLPQKAKFG